MNRSWLKLVAAVACTAVVLAAVVLRNRPADAASEAVQPLVEATSKFLVEPYLQFATRTQITVMWETEVPYSAVVLGAHPHRDMAGDVGPSRVEADAIGVKAAPVVGGRVRRRMLRDRDDSRLAVPAQMEERAVRIMLRIVSPAADSEQTPAAPARAVGPQRDGVTAVRQQVRRLHN